MNQFHTWIWKVNHYRTFWTTLIFLFLYILYRYVFTSLIKYGEFVIFLPDLFKYVLVAYFKSLLCIIDVLGRIPEFVALFLHTTVGNYSLTIWISDTTCLSLPQEFWASSILYCLLLSCCLFGVSYWHFLPIICVLCSDVFNEQRLNINLYLFTLHVYNFCFWLWIEFWGWH
jgi:hypothetical protein